MIVDASVCEKLAEIIQNLFRGPIFRTWSSAPKPFAAQVHALMIIGICISLCIRLSRQDAGGGGGTAQPSPPPHHGGIMSLPIFEKPPTYIRPARRPFFAYIFCLKYFQDKIILSPCKSVPIRFRLFRSLAI